MPSPLFDNATAFTDPDGVVRRPFNNFLQQATTLDQYGRPFSQLLNVHATTDTSMAYEDGVFTYNFTFCNDGGRTLTAPYKITYYADVYGGPVIRTETVTTSLMVDNCKTITTQFTDEELNVYQGLANIVVAVNDNGQGVA